MSNLVQRLPQPIKRPLRRVKRLGEELKAKNDPEFLIVGAQKAGTTSLHFYLNQNPEMSGSVPKETHFFNKHLYFRWQQTDYRSCFRGGAKEVPF
jgi:rRNA maturation protein Rpf1